MEITDLDISANGLVPADVQELEIPEDGTNTDPYDGNGTETVLLTVPEGATRMIVNLRNATAPDFDLYVGKGSEPSAATEVAFSASGGSAESVDIPLESGDAGEWWILVQNWEASAPGGTDTVDLETAVVAGDAGNLSAEGPATNPQGEPFTIRTFWDESRMRAGQTWYGSLTLDAAPGGTRIGTIPVTVNRVQDDVTKSADRDQAAPRETITYTVEVQPNVTPEDQTYTFRDQLPEGTTYVEGSGPEGSTLEDGVLTWEAEMPTVVGVDGAYEWSTSATDESCANPFNGGGYVDLAGFGIPPQPAVVGDGVLFTALPTRSYGFYESNQMGLAFSDDGFLQYGGPDFYTGEVETPQVLPDAAEPNNLAAMLWQDMQLVYDQAAGSGVSIATAGAGLAIIEFDDLRLADDPSGAQGTTDMQVFAETGSRDLVFAYDNVGGPVGAVTIGAENADASQGSALVNAGDASAVIGDDVVVCGTYTKDDGPRAFTYQVTVDDDVLDGQVLRNRLTHTVDNPGAEPVRLEQFVTVVEGAEPPEVTVETERDAKEPHRDGIVVFTRPDSAVGSRLTVEYDVGGDAVRGVDYLGLDGTVTFQADEDRATEFVQVIDRKRKQPVRRVLITLSEGEGYTVGDPFEAIVRILDRSARG